MFTNSRKNIKMFDVKLTSPMCECHFVMYVYITVISIQARIDGRLLSAVFLALVT